MSDAQNWLQGAVVYQIYPRSFKDASGKTGVGNLRGIIDKLDYLGGKPDSLGVTAIWISPIYASPMADFGYDVKDYAAVDPIFGNLHDADTLILESHKRDIKIILDFVPNHSSDEHPWFVESSSSLDNPKRNWYVWRDAKPDGSAPNNWLSVFGGSAWTLSKKTNQYYLHSFLAKQPDLNWDNPAVRQAIKAAMRFWLDKGIDGFRMDAVDWISKDDALRDDPVDKFAINKTAGFDHESLHHRYSREGPHLFEYLNEMAEVLAEYPGRFMITEAHPELNGKVNSKVAGYLQYYQEINPHLSAPFNFESIYLPWEAPKFRAFVDSFQAAMQPGYTPIYTVGNHDESRIASRIGLPAARTAAVMLLTLPGMAFIYNGEEIGMTDVSIAQDQLRDPFLGFKHGRDPQRTPMQWDASPNAGFSIATPWLPVADDYKVKNVVAESKDPASMLSLYKRLLRLRRQSPALKYGTYKPIDTPTEVFGYKRIHGTNELIVLLNFSDSPQPYGVSLSRADVVLSSYPEATARTANKLLMLRPNEAVIIEVKND